MTFHKKNDDISNRDRIALCVISISIIAVLAVSITVIWKSENKEEAAQRVMTATLPLYGTWVGTILAYYFSRNAFEAASSASTRSATLFQQLTNAPSTSSQSDEVLSKIILKSLANGLVFSQNNLRKPLTEVLEEMIAKNRHRMIVVNTEKVYIDLVLRVNIASYLVPLVDNKSTSSPPTTIPTLEEYLKWRNSQGELSNPKVVFLPQSATLADANVKLKKTIGCRDVIVTTDGGEKSQVVVYITDVDVNEYNIKNVSESS